MKVDDVQFVELHGFVNVIEVKYPLVSLTEHDRFLA
jgi:hypothetical protein